jgi:hypothetical protein
MAGEPVWRKVAIEMMPELESRLRKLQTPYLLWRELRQAFENAYKEPRNASLIERIYRFAAWCERQPGGETPTDDLATCVSVSFLEYLPCYAPARADMPNWFTKEEFIRMKPVFRRHASEEEFQELRTLFKD